MISYSVVVPVYNRPDEMEELCETLSHQSYKNFTLVVVEDGSTKPCENVLEKYRSKFQIDYYFKNKEGPSAARNFGFTKSKNDYIVLFDSDLLVPPDYFAQVTASLETTDPKNRLDCYGGPDRAHPSFTILQKAINYSMTSALTTGGIRGRKKHVGQFNPRSFNMGFSQKVYQTVGGFIDMHPGEDIDFSLRIIKAGFKVGLIENAYVYHKRRTDLKKFYLQVYKFGLKRIEIYEIHPTELKLTHLFPTFFTLYFLLCIFGILFLPIPGLIFAAPMILYLGLIFIDSTIVNKNIIVGFLSVVTTLIQMYGYGKGIAENILKKLIRGKIRRNS